MFSWTINGKEYTAPQGYGEITVAEFEAYWATVEPIKPKRATVTATATPSKMLAKLIARLSRKKRGTVQPQPQPQPDPCPDITERIEYETAFVQHWLKLPARLVHAIDYVDIRAIHDTLIKSWSAWVPEANIGRIHYRGKLWVLDLSLETLLAIPADSPPQVSLSRLMVCNGKRERPRYWGGLSLHITASIMACIADHHKTIAGIAVNNMIETFKISQQWPTR